METIPSPWLGFLRGVFLANRLTKTTKRQKRYQQKLTMHEMAPNKEQYNMKNAQRSMQTLRAGCSKAEPKNFVPPQTPFPGAQDGQNLIS